MRTKNPSYVSNGNLVARVRISDGKGGTVIKRLKQRVPEHITAPSEQAKWARMMVNNLKKDDARGRTLEYLQAMQRRRTCCSAGDIFERLDDENVLVRKTLKDARKMKWALYRVAATAYDLWTTAEKVRGVKAGEKVPDRERIHALTAAKLLSAETVRLFFMGALGVETLEWRKVYERAASINSVLLQARSNFQGLSLRVKMQGLDLPELGGFMSGRLATDDALPEPVEAAEFAKVVELFAGVKDLRRELWLCNLVIRQTGCRSLSTAMQLHRSWLRKLEDGYWINVEGKTRYQVPITEELAAEVLKSDNFLFFPDAPDADEAAKKRNAALRGALLDEHTALLKGVIGAGSGGQVNHRMRDTVASACYHWLGIEVAQEALGHADAKTTRKHYAQRMDVSELMKHELRAWKRVLRRAGEDRPANVVPMNAAA